MTKKQFSKFNCRFNNIDDLIGSIDNKELMLLLKKHNINLEQEIGEVVAPLNKSGKMFPLLTSSPALPSDKAIDAAQGIYQREGVLSYYPEYIFADDYGMGFVVRYRENKDIDKYALIVRDYKVNNSYSKIFSNHHNLPENAIKEYVNGLDFNDLTKLPFYKDHLLTYHALCLSTKYTGNVYVHEVSPKIMESAALKPAVLSKVMEDKEKHGYDIVALYSKGSSIIHCDDKMGNPFDAFTLDVEYYGQNKEKIHEEHYVFAYGQEYKTYLTADGQIFRDSQNRIYYDIQHTTKAKGKLTPFEEGEAEAVFYQFFASEFSNRYPLLDANVIS